jgi:hypothetical protein
MAAVPNRGFAWPHCAVCGRRSRNLRVAAAPFQPEHRSILIVDIESFSRSDRINPIQLGLRRYLRRLLVDALAQAAVSPEHYDVHDRGDGFLVSISPMVPKSRLIVPFIPTLADGLDSYNEATDEARRMRLRVVLHAGELLRDPRPNVGYATIFAVRLLDAQELRATLTEAKGPLALIVSDWFYQEVVQHRYGGIDPASYRPVTICVKGIRARAWVSVPGDPEAVERAGIVA